MGQVARGLHFRICSCDDFWPPLRDIFFCQMDWTSSGASASTLAPTFEDSDAVVWSRSPEDAWAPSDSCRQCVLSPDNLDACLPFGFWRHLHWGAPRNAATAPPSIYLEECNHEYLPPASGCAFSWNCPMAFWCGFCEAYGLTNFADALLPEWPVRPCGPSRWETYDRGHWGPWCRPFSDCHPQGVPTQVVSWPSTGFGLPASASILR